MNDLVRMVLACWVQPIIIDRWVHASGEASRIDGGERYSPAGTLEHMLDGNSLLLLPSKLSSLSWESRIKLSFWDCPSCTGIIWSQEGFVFAGHKCALWIWHCCGALYRRQDIHQHHLISVVSESSSECIPAGCAESFLPSYLLHVSYGANCDCAQWPHNQALGKQPSLWNICCCWTYTRDASHDCQCQFSPWCEGHGK